MANVKVMLWFDVEDYITPQAQESLLALLRMLNRRNVKGIFKIVGEKARRLERDGRTDIWAEMSGHEIGYHTDMHSEHPVSTEYLERCGFRDGAVEYEARERGGLADLRRIAGKPAICFGQAGYAWAPQTYAALKHWGIPVYLDDHDHIRLDGRPFWYGGLLNLTNLRGTMRMELVADGLEKAKEQFDELYASLASEPVGFVSIYYHPCEFACRGFWDAANFARGRNTPREEWRPAPLRPEGETERYLDMLGRFIDYTLSKENVEYIGSEQALALERSGTGPVEPSLVKELAAGIGNALGFRIAGGRSFSAAELHSLFRRYLLGMELLPELLYGPEADAAAPGAEVGAGAIRVDDVKRALAVEYPEALGTPQLPETFEVGGVRVHAVDLTCTMARIIADGLGDGDRVELVRGALESAKHAGDDDLWGPRWIIFPEELRVPNVVRMSKLQTWTLKPALF
ncbi:hypothetical protein [Paenibacillus flagellatus]|uniref:hypothetical protein n=1 Tax=Paenibacillus flagellatus TaxID=2211139 RepID=UPI0011B5DC6E|nr:hypothetical protein [Paenibacillus flagellatus]